MDLDIKTYDQMVEALSEGQDKKGNKIDVKKYDVLSTKKLSHLWREIRKREVHLAYLQLGGYRRVIRAARSGSAFITVPAKHCKYLEICRLYPWLFPREEAVVRNVKETTYTETLLRGETALKALVRAGREEMRRKFDPGQFKEKEVHNGRDEFEEHESSVYYALRSHVQVYRYDLVLPDLPWPEETRLFSDNDTWNCVQRFHHAA